VAPTQTTCREERYREDDERWNIPLRGSAEVTTDDVGHGVEGRRATNPDERDRQPVDAPEHARKQKNRPEADLERTHVL
jgi:hypothetical protein